jgi:hypothetical protein
MHSDEAAIEKQSANIWWSEHLGRPIPARVPPQAYFQRSPAPALDEPHIALAMVLAVLGIVFAPFAIGAWILAGHELRRIELGSASDRGKAWLVVAKGLGAVMTVVAAAMLAGVVVQLF